MKFIGEEDSDNTDTWGEEEDVCLDAKALTRWVYRE